MKNKSLKDIFFYLALIPYVLFVIMCIYYAIAGYDDFILGNVYGIAAVRVFILDIFGNVLIIFLRPIDFCLFFFWIGYQIYYFVTFNKCKKEENENYQQSDNVNLKSCNKKIGLKQILFYVSLVCWGLYFASGIYAFFFGSNAGGGLFSHYREYGIEAMVNTLYWTLIAFSVIPILPISLIYIIIYLVVKKRNEK